MKNFFHSAQQYRWLVWGLLAAAYMISFFHRMSVSVVKDDLMTQYGLSVVEFGSLASMYFYAYCLAQIPSGLLADKLGVRRTATACITLTGLGTLLFGCAEGATMLFAGRFIVGLGVASSFVCVMKCQSQWFREREFGTLAGLCLFVGTIGSVSAQAPLGALVSAVSLSGAFYSIGAATLLLALACVLFVRDTPQDLGFAPIVEKTSPAGGSSVSLARIIRDPGLLALDIFYFFMGSQLLGFAGSWSIAYLRDTYALPLQQASTLASVQLVAFMVGSLVIGYLSDRSRRRKPYIVWPFVIVTLTWGILAVGQDALGLSCGIVLLGVAGFFSGAFSVMMTLCKELTPGPATGTAIAVLNTFGFGGIALSTPLYGYFLSIAEGTGNHAYAVIFMAVVTGLGCLTSFFLRESGGRQAMM